MRAPPRGAIFVSRSVYFTELSLWSQPHSNRLTSQNLSQTIKMSCAGWVRAIGRRRLKTMVPAQCQRESVILSESPSRSEIAFQCVALHDPAKSSSVPCLPLEVNTSSTIYFYLKTFICSFPIVGALRSRRLHIQCE